MFVSDKNPVKAFGSASNLREALPDLASAETGIDQDAGFVGFEVGAVPTGTASKNSQPDRHASKRYVNDQPRATFYAEPVKGNAGFLFRGFPLRQTSMEYKRPFQQQPPNNRIGMMYLSGPVQKRSNEPAIGPIATENKYPLSRRTSIVGSILDDGRAPLKQFCLWLGIVLLGASAIMAFPGRPVHRAKSLSISPQRQTGLLFHPVYLKHLSGNSGHPERPERLIAIGGALEKAGLFRSLFRIRPRRVTDQELELVHSPSYVAKVRQELSNVDGYRQLSTGDTLVSHDSLEAAEFAAGGVLNAVDAVMAGKIRNGFAGVRPPGHHATPERGMGFCIFNNVAIAARYLQRVHGLQRILIVDWDYHHGNGTQDTFYQDGSVFYFSTHNYGAYPGTGSSAETGAGNGAGEILNVPLPVGAGDSQILQAFQNKLVPAARDFQPDFILISAGFDGMRNDLLGLFDVTPEGFAAITRVVVNLADELCQGRVVSVMEGGYRLDGLAESVVAHVKALRGE